MPRSPMSSDSLTEPSPTPPPPTSRKTSMISAAGTKVSGLDSDSELSDLTDDEQENEARERGESASQQAPRRQARKKREDDADIDVVLPPSSAIPPDHQVNGQHDQPEQTSPQVAGLPSPSPAVPPVTDTVADGDDDLSTVEDPESEDDNMEEVDDDQSIETSIHVKRRKVEVTISAALTDADEREPSQSPVQQEVESEDESVTESEAGNEVEQEDAEEEEDDADDDDNDEEVEDEDDGASVGPVENGMDDEQLEDAEMDEPEAPVSVVPLAPAPSSIMAGQQNIIKTPTPSPSPSPEPDEDEDETQAKREENERDRNGDDLDADMLSANGLTGENDADLDADEEGDLDMQPAHRQEALEVLATIELKFALLRERLYVEKMEDLAQEEEMIFLESHPEMTMLQAELQKRHDRRIDLALKRRRYEESNISVKRKTDEDAIWSWWLNERDLLQTTMLGETNRKKRKVQRDQRLLDRPLPALRMPSISTYNIPQHPINLRAIVQNTSFENSHSDLKSKRKRRVQPTEANVYPSLSALSPSEIQSDLQFLSSRRPYNPHMMDVVPGVYHPEQQYNDAYGHPQNSQRQQMPYSQGQSSSMHQYPPVSAGRPYGQYPPPPVGAFHTSKDPYGRAMLGPGQPSSFYPQRPGFDGYGAPTNQQSAVPRSPSPGRATYGPGGMHSVGPASHPVENGQPTWGPGTMVGPGGMSVKNTAPNGWKKEHRNRLSSGISDGREHDLQKEPSREKDGGWGENGRRDSQMDEAGRDQFVPMHPQVSRQPHRHTLQHQILQDTPHHHHVVHNHPTRRHLSPRSSSQSLGSRQHEADRHFPQSEMDSFGRRAGPTVETINLVPKQVTPAWSSDDADHRRQIAGPSPHLRPSPSFADRQPFVMTPTQASQVDLAGPSRVEPPRREPWVEEPGRRLPPTVGPGQGQATLLPANHGFDHSPAQTSQRSIQPSPQHSEGYATLHPMNHRLPSPRRIAPPPSPHPSHMSSPGRSAHSVHLSGGHLSPVSSIAPRPPRPLSPISLKAPGSNYPFSPPPIGPGVVANHSRTPLATSNGVGHRPEHLSPDDHGSGSRTLLSSPHVGAVMGANYLGGTESPRLPPPPKLSVLPLGSTS